MSRQPLPRHHPDRGRRPPNDPGAPSGAPPPTASPSSCVPSPTPSSPAGRSPTRTRSASPGV